MIANTYDVKKARFHSVLNVVNDNTPSTIGMTTIHAGSRPEPSLGRRSSTWLRNGRARPRTVSTRMMMMNGRASPRPVVFSR